VWDGSSVSLLHAERNADAWSSDPVDSKPNSGYEAKILAVATGSLRIFYQRLDDAAGVFLASGAAGSWSVERIGDDLRSSLDVARDGAGAFHVWGLYQGYVGPYGTNSDGTWRSEIVDDAQPEGALAVDGENRPHVAFTTPGFDFSSLPTFGIREAAGWSIEPLPYGRDPQGGMSIAVDARGCDHVFYSSGGVVHATDCDVPPPDGIDQDCDGHDG
jgi:hypothetical protein